MFQVHKSTLNKINIIQMQIRPTISSKLKYLRQCQRLSCFFFLRQQAISEDVYGFICDLWRFHVDCSHHHVLISALKRGLTSLISKNTYTLQRLFLVVTLFVSTLFIDNWLLRKSFRLPRNFLNMIKYLIESII